MRIPGVILLTVVAIAPVLSLSQARLARAGEDPIGMPKISEEVCPVTDLRVSETSYAAVRKPPGAGPFPAVVFLHGGLSQTGMDKLRRDAIGQPTELSVTTFCNFPREFSPA